MTMPIADIYAQMSRLRMAPAIPDQRILEAAQADLADRTSAESARLQEGVAANGASLEQQSSEIDAEDQAKLTELQQTVAAYQATLSAQQEQSRQIDAAQGKLDTLLAKEKERIRQLQEELMRRPPKKVTHTIHAQGLILKGSQFIPVHEHSFQGSTYRPSALDPRVQERTGLAPRLHPFFARQEGHI